MCVSVSVCVCECVWIRCMLVGTCALYCTVCASDRYVCTVHPTCLRITVCVPLYVVLVCMPISGSCEVLYLAELLERI